MKVKKILLPISFLLLLSSLSAQKLINSQAALDHINSSYTKWDLKKGDITDLILTNNYVSTHNGIHHFYFQQRYKGIPVYAAITGVHFQENGELIQEALGFYPNLSNKVNSPKNILSPQQALNKALIKLEISSSKSTILIQERDQIDYLFARTDMSQLDVPVKLQYYPVENQLRLSWEVGILPLNSSDYWAVQIDAQNGQIISQINQTLQCAFEHGVYESHDDYCVEEGIQKIITSQVSNPNSNDDAIYRVFPVPVESPIHGQRQLLVSPADPLASPFGWHDTNAVVGPEFFTTKGNNVHAYFDIQDNNLPDGDEVVQEDLVFDYNYNPEREPLSNKKAALTQLFYMNNFMHDFTYNYGFDEQAGNFQNFNYQTAGKDGDAIDAEALDGSRKNNATFLPRPDGSPGRMQMFLWNRKSLQHLNIPSPSPLAGSYRSNVSSFGPNLDSLTIRGQIVQAFDDSEFPFLACNTIVNKEEVAGKIALIYRGDCSYVEKVSNAQEAGAIGVIIANYANSLITPGGNPTIPITIPTIAVASSTADRIISELENGVTAIFQKPNEFPEELDASFDNGVTAHEYAHGISHRLTGGPGTTACLGNDEQMGEGWSDFFALVVSTQSSNLNQRTKGIGNFVNGSKEFGGGIRRRPYSPYLEINEFTYKDIINTTGPHRVGEVWATMLWDLYWALSDKHGWNPDIVYGQGGNNMAIQLVMDGMKLQKCRPGFIDGRDAILKADTLNNGAANSCLIWEVFARRGLGWSASQGHFDNRKDGIEAFDLPPSCTPVLKIRKVVSSSIEAGEIIQTTLTIRNDKTTNASGLIINDLLPEGTELDPFSVTGAELLDQNGDQIRFKIEGLGAGESIEVNYSLQTSPELGSKEIFFDDFDLTGFIWQARARRGSDGWRRITDTLRNFEKAWFVPNTINFNNQILEFRRNIPVAGELPVIRFHHNFIVEPVSDGGLVEISTDRGRSWKPIGSDKFLRNGYSGEMAFSTLFLKDQGGFYGDQSFFRETIIDLRDYLGQEIRIRFHFYSDEEPEEEPFDTGVGWQIDDIEFMDLYHYNTEVCLTSDQGDFICTKAPDLGTTVGSVEEITSANELEDKNNFNIQIFPNPVKDYLQIQVESKQTAEQVHFQLLSLDGRILQSKQQDIFEGKQTLLMNIAQLPSGMYWLKIQQQNGVISKKIVKR